MAELKPKSESDQHITPDQIRDSVPYGLRAAAAWSWRLAAVGVVLWAIFTFLGSVIGIVIPLIVAMLIAAPLGKVVDVLQSIKIHRGIGAAIVILTLGSVIGALVLVAGNSIIRGFDELSVAAVAGFYDFLDWLESGFLEISTEQLQAGVESLVTWFRDNVLGLASSAANVTGAVGAIFAGILIGVFALFYFLRDGRTMWTWTVNLLPGNSSERVDRAGLNAWRNLSKYTASQVVVALIDGVLIGLGAWIIGVPLVVPIAILVFLFSFIPWIGAFLAGSVAVLVALFGGGFTDAVWMLAVVLLVQTIEGNVLYPLIFGKAASIHPLVIIVTVTVGTLLIGIVGAIVAVPIVSFVYAFIVGLRREFQLPPDEPSPLSQQIPILAQRSKESLGKVREVLKTGEIRIRKPKDDGDDGRGGL